MVMIILLFLLTLNGIYKGEKMENTENIEEKYEVCVTCKKMKLKEQMFYVSFRDYNTDGLLDIWVRRGESPCPKPPLHKYFDEWECIDCIFKP